MKLPLFFFFFALPAYSQLVSPSWRDGLGTSYSEWDVFTEANFAPNHPDVSGGTASITCTTPSAFIASSGNIYSFSAPTFFQLDHSTNQSVTNLFLQIKALGSGIDLGSATLIADNTEGETFAVNATHTMIVSEEELGGERGGIGTIYTLQWDLRSTPITGGYSVLFNATESSLSLDRVSLDTSSSYEIVPRPKPLDLQIKGNEIHLSWLGGGHLQSSSSLTSEWTDVPESIGKNSIIIPKTSSTRFFRVRQSDATE